MMLLGIHFEVIDTKGKRHEIVFNAFYNIQIQII